jgi:nucleoside-diphosphate-sugar epimerase
MYLVTGGGGFIGSHLVRALVQRGEPVRVVDNGFSGSRKRVADVLRDIEWVDGDVRDRSTMLRACRGVEVVLHQAAIPSVAQSVEDPELTNAVNLGGTLTTLLAARDAGVRRVVLASSSAVYGNRPGIPRVETQPTEALSPYAAQKLAAETYCQVWYSLYGVETVALRYFNVFGPGQDPKSEYAAAIPRFIQAMLAGETLTIYGDGEQKRDFIYVSNIVDINLRAAVAPEAAGQIINAGSGHGVTINQLLETLGHIAGRPIQLVHAAARPGEVRESVADISRMREALAYAPAVSLADGLALTLSAFASAPDPALTPPGTR